MAFSPFLHARNALLATLNKVLKSYIRLSPTAVQTFLLIAQKQGVEPRPLRFALDASGAVVLRAVCDSDPEDAAWSFANLATSSFTREIDAILTCWVINGEYTWLSELFVSLLDVASFSPLHPKHFFTSSLLSSGMDSAGLLLLRILDMDMPSLFGEHLLAGLRSIEHIFLILRKQAQEPEALTLSEDAVVSILGIVQSACGVAA